MGGGQPASLSVDRRWKRLRLGRVGQWLLALGEVVEDVPSATNSAGELVRDGRRKNDVVDAAAAGSVVALPGAASPVMASI